MNNNSMLRSGRVNGAFAVVFILITAAYAAAMYNRNSRDAAEALFPTFFFMAAILALGAFRAWYWRQRLANYMKTLDRIVEAAVHNKQPLAPFEETAASSLEYKLQRYFRRSEASEHKLEAEKNKIKTLISDISHQTKTPLANIILYAQLMEEAAEHQLPVAEYLRLIKTQSEKLDWLIQSLIKLSRLESGMIALQTETGPILNAVTAALSQVYMTAESKGIELEVDCAPHINAYHDAKWTSEALFNLLENAVKYMEPGGNIRLSARSNEMFTQIDVSDTGPGIAPEDLPHIFKRFYRGRNALEAEGVGIGLYLTREIITAQGGHIQADSEEGSGTTFSLYLPHHSHQ